TCTPSSLPLRRSRLRKRSNSSRVTFLTGSETSSQSGPPRSMRVRFVIARVSNRSRTTFITIQFAQTSSPPQNRSPTPLQADNISLILFLHTSQRLPGLKPPSTYRLIQEPEGSCSLRASGWRSFSWLYFHENGPTP